MAMTTKLYRCAACGSTQVEVRRTETEGMVYRCQACRAVRCEGMPAADLAVANRISVFGGSEEELRSLRRKYRNLDMTAWTAESKLSI